MVLLWKARDNAGKAENDPGRGRLLRWKRNNIDENQYHGYFLVVTASISVGKGK